MVFCLQEKQKHMPKTTHGIIIVDKQYTFIVKYGTKQIA
jgi:hypothetical protein